MGRVPGDAGLLEVPDEFEGIAIGAIGQNGGLFPGNNGVEASGGAWIVVAPSTMEQLLALEVAKFVRRILAIFEPVNSTHAAAGESASSSR